MSRLLRRLNVADLLAVAYTAGYFCWLALRTPGTSATALAGEFTFYPLGLAVAWASWRTSRLPFLDRRTRLAWRLHMGSAISLFVSGTAWSIYSRLFGASGTPSWVEYLEVVSVVLAMAGFIAFPGRVLAGRSRTRFFLDATLMAVAGFAVALYFGLRLWFGRLQSEPFTPAELARVIDWINFVVVAVAVLQKREAATRAALGAFLLAGGVYLVGNYVYLSASPDAYHSGDAVDGFWFAAWALRWAAARVVWYRCRKTAGEPDYPAAAAATTYESSPFSYLMLAAGFALLTSQVFAEDRQLVGLLAISAAVMAGLLVTRQLVELREHQRLVAARRAQEARFRSLVSQSSDVVLVVDSGGVVSYASPSAARVFGDGSAVKEGARLADLVLAEDRPALALVFDGGDRTSHRLAVRMRAADGKWRDIEAVCTDMRGDPAVAGIVVNCRDMSEHTELERQLRHTQKLDAVGHLAGGLAHDMNNVLAIIRGYTELLRLDLPGDSVAADDLRHIEQAVDRAAAVTEKVLAFSRRQPVQLKPLDLNAVVRGVEPMIRQLAGARACVSIDCAPDLWTVIGDVGQLEQVIVNLVTNARDAMPDGASLEVITANRMTDGTSSDPDGPAPGDYATVMVRDHGTGMAPDVQARIFDPFFSTKSKEHGVGLGLAMVQGIVLGSRGHVVVESAPGRGSTFTVMLPRTHQRVVGAAVGGEAPDRPDRPYTVLLVEDETNVRIVARRILERDGYRIIEAADGLAALDAIADPEVEVDVLLTDMVMPGMHGRDLIARFSVARPGIPVVCMTGFAGGEGDDAGNFGEGLFALVTKPFTADVLRRTIAAAVARRVQP